MKSFLTPTVHINGTPARVLESGWRELLEALDVALEKAHALEFNARDYYVRPDTDFAVAKRAFEQRVAELRAFRDDAQEVVEDLEQAAELRKRTKGGTL